SRQGWCYPAKFAMIDIFPVLLNFIDRRFGQVWLYLLIQFQDYIELIVLKRRTSISIFTAATPAFCQVTDKLFLDNFITHKNIIDYNHSKRFAAKLGFYCAGCDSIMPVL